MEKQEKKKTMSLQEQKKKREFIYFSEEEKRKIIEEMLERDCTKQEIWEKYTGRKQEHGSIIVWMRQLGYIEGYKETDKNSKFAKRANNMEDKGKEKDYEKIMLEKRIEQLEKRLKEAEMKEVAYNIMVEIIKEEYGIDLKKKTRYQVVEKMREKYTEVSLSEICRCLEVTRQAYYKNRQATKKREIEEYLILKEVEKIRKEQPRIGTRKIYVKMEDFFKEHKIKIGRDKLFEILRINDMLIKKKRCNRVKTTMSHHWLKKYKNITKGFEPQMPNQLWVSDITYLKIENGFVYISLITDAYSHKIVGYHVANTLESIETIEALRMAISDLKRSPESHYELIHHSDRGLQYCDHRYVKLLTDNNIKISMTETGDPLDNAIAERTNGIIKGEYLEYKKINTIKEAKAYLSRAVYLYNNERPHNSIGNLYPNDVHQNNIKVKKLWKNYKKNYIFAN